MTKEEQLNWAFDILDDITQSVATYNLCRLYRGGDKINLNCYADCPFRYSGSTGQGCRKGDAETLLGAMAEGD